jgi:hypothetical protein
MAERYNLITMTKQQLDKIVGSIMKATAQIATTTTENTNQTPPQHARTTKDLKITEPNPFTANQKISNPSSEKAKYASLSKTISMTLLPRKCTLFSLSLNLERPRHGRNNTSEVVKDIDLL